ncbi:MAG: hypothetical protein ACKO2G_02280 [Verrucomicrobiales bacterium]
MSDHDIPNGSREIMESLRPILESTCRLADHTLTDHGHAIPHEERDMPTPYILAAQQMLRALGGTTIVDLGCMRSPIKHAPFVVDRACCADGHSTLLWAHAGFVVYSCDINPEAVALASQATAAYANCSVTCADGIEFIKNFGGTIDLLYLDAWDVVENTPFAERHLEAYLAARPKLAANHLVVVDDTDVVDGGKGRLLMPELVAQGYQIVVMGRQTIALFLAGYAPMIAACGCNRITQLSAKIARYNDLREILKSSASFQLPGFTTRAELEEKLKLRKESNQRLRDKAARLEERVAKLHAQLDSAIAWQSRSPIVRALRKWRRPG